MDIEKLTLSLIESASCKEMDQFYECYYDTDDYNDYSTLLNKLYEIENSSLRSKLLSEFVFELMERTLVLENLKTIDVLIDFDKKRYLIDSILEYDNSVTIYNFTKYIIKYGDFKVFEYIYDNLLIDYFDVNEVSYNHDFIDQINILNIIIKEANPYFLEQFLEKFKDNLIFNNVNYFQSLTDNSESILIHKLEKLISYNCDISYGEKFNYSSDNLLSYSLTPILGLTPNQKLFEFLLKDDNFNIKKTKYSLNYLFKASDNLDNFKTLLNRYENIFTPYLNKVIDNRTLISKAVEVDNRELFTYLVEDLNLDANNYLNFANALSSKNRYYIDSLIEKGFDLSKPFHDLEYLTKLLFEFNDYDLFKALVNSNSDLKDFIMSDDFKNSITYKSTALYDIDIKFLKQFDNDYGVNLKTQKPLNIYLEHKLNKLGEVNDVIEVLKFYRDKIEEVDLSLIVEVLKRDSNNNYNLEVVMKALLEANFDLKSYDLNYYSAPTTVTKVKLRDLRYKIALFIDYGLIKDVNSFSYDNNFTTNNLSNSESPFYYKDNYLFINYLKENGFSTINKDYNAILYYLNTGQFNKLNDHLDIVLKEGLYISNDDLKEIISNLNELLRNSNSNRDNLYIAPKLLNCLNKFAYNSDYIRSSLDSDNLEIYDELLKRIVTLDIGVDDFDTKSYLSSKLTLFKDIDDIKLVLLSKQLEYKILTEYKEFLVDKDNLVVPILPITGSFIKDEQINKKLFEPLFEKKLIELDLSDNSVKDL